MGNSESYRFSDDAASELNTVKNSTSFTHGEINYLYERFHALGQPRRRRGILKRKDFNFGLHALHSVILNAMFENKHEIKFIEFVKFLNNFRTLDSKSTEEECAAMHNRKLKLLFSMYDVDKDGSISKEDLLDIVHMLFSDYTDIKTMLKIVQIVMKEMDNTKTSRIFFDDFCKAFEVFDMDQLVVKFPSL